MLLACEKNNVKFNSDYTTNGFLITNERAKMLKKWKTSQIQITLDGNREKHNTVRFVSKSRGSYNDIIKNIGILTSKELFVRVRINYTRETLHGVNDIIQDLK